MVFNDGDFKNGISFSFRIPPDLAKGAAVAACAAVTAKIENTHKQSCDTSILWFSTVGISKMGSVIESTISTYVLKLHIFAIFVNCYF